MLRKQAINELARVRGRNVICYYSGWMQHDQPVMDMNITDNDVNGLMNAICGMDRSIGLDIVLHTPGGDLGATEAIVEYLRDCFGNNVCAIVPQLAMSAGTMIACSCNEIIMGRQSSLGPTDPQVYGMAAGGVIEEFNQAVDDVTANPATAPLWAQIIGKYHPTYLGDCQKAVDMSRDMLGKWLSKNMFEGDPDAKEKTEKIVGLLCDHSESAMHNRHFNHEKLESIGLNVTMMEEDDELQDRIMTLHHHYMINLHGSPTVKIIESSTGAGWGITIAPMADLQ